MTAILSLKRQRMRQRRELIRAQAQGDAIIIIFPGIRYERLNDDHYFETTDYDGNQKIKQEEF